MADPCVCHCSSMSHSYVAVICRCWSKFIRVQAVRAASVKRPCYLLRSESVTSRVWVSYVTHISGSYHTYYLNVLHCLYLYYCNAASLSFQPQLAYRNSHAFLLYHLKLASLSDLRSGSVSGNQLLIGRTSSDRSNMIGRTRPSCLLHSRAHDDLVRPITTCSTYRYIRGRMPATFESGHYTTLESGHYTTSRADITLHRERTLHYIWERTLHYIESGHYTTFESGHYTTFEGAGTLPCCEDCDRFWDDTSHWQLSRRVTPWRLERALPCIPEYQDSDGWRWGQ